MRLALALCALLVSGCGADQPLDWTSRYAADQKYVNKSNISATVFSSPNSTSQPTGSINPGSGGFIQTCNDDLSWCRLSYGGLGASGWVNMTPFFAEDA